MKALFVVTILAGCAIPEYERIAVPGLGSIECEDTGGDWILDACQTHPGAVCLGSDGEMRAFGCTYTGAAVNVDCVETCGE